MLKGRTGLDWQRHHHNQQFPRTIQTACHLGMAGRRYHRPVQGEPWIDMEAVRRRIVRDWRSRTGGAAVRDSLRPTLLAVSGGADSCALALALAGRTGIVGLGHIVHDLRPAEQSHADRMLVERLGQRLGLPVWVDHVRVPPGNAEGQARRVRYSALERMACAQGCAYVAAAHQADDVFETMLAHLIRGTGPRGLRGPAPRRRLSDSVTLVRPMLHVTRRETEAICRAHDWVWASDATNADTGNADAPLRAALRARVLPVLEELRPGAARRAVRSAEAIGQAQRVVQAAIDHAWPRVARGQSPVMLDAREFSACEPAVREGILRKLIEQLGGAGHDRLSAATAKSLVAWVAGGRGKRLAAGLCFEHHGPVVLVSLA